MKFNQLADFLNNIDRAYVNVYTEWIYVKAAMLQVFFNLVQKLQILPKDMLVFASVSRKINVNLYFYWLMKNKYWGFECL